MARSARRLANSYSHPTTMSRARDASKKSRWWCGGTVKLSFGGAGSAALVLPPGDTDAPTNPAASSPAGYVIRTLKETLIRGELPT